MYVEPFRVRLTFRPRDDVRGTKKGYVGNAGQGTAALPVIHQAGPKNVLADALHDKTLGFSGPRQIGDSDLEFA